jgi:hypothetical protein
MAEAGLVEFVIQGTTLDGKPRAYRFLINFVQRVGDTA